VITISVDAGEVILGNDQDVKGGRWTGGEGMVRDRMGRELRVSAGENSRVNIGFQVWAPSHLFNAFGEPGILVPSWPRPECN